MGIVTTPYPHQVDALERLREAVKGREVGTGRRKRVMLQAPTAFGKTILAAMVVDAALEKGNRVAFGVPAVELIDQTVCAFYDEGIADVGVIQANHHMTNPNRKVQVCSPQTLSRRLLPDVGVVVIDEAHRRFRVYEDWMAERPDMIFVGLSATPWTKGLGRFYDELIVAARAKDLIRMGFLSSFRVFAPSSPDLTGVRTVAGDYHEGDLGKIAAQDALVGDVVRTWTDKAEGRPTLCYAVDCAHARSLRDRFAAAGVPVGYVDAMTPKRERDEVRIKFEHGIVKVVCNVGVLTTGVDWDVRCISLARPTKSEILFTQIIGRGLRTAPGKDYLLVLDHSDSHFRLGFVDDIHHDSLNDGTPSKLVEERSPPMPRPCPSCAMVLPPATSRCPSCGYERPHSSLPVDEVDGELSEVTRIEKRKANRKATPEDKARFYAELLGYAIDRSFKSGWAANVYRERYDVWPNAHRYVEPLPPGRQTMNWVKHRNIAWAKRMTREQSGREWLKDIVARYGEEDAD